MWHENPPFTASFASLQEPKINRTQNTPARIHGNLHFIADTETTAVTIKVTKSRVDLILDAAVFFSFFQTLRCRNNPYQLLPTKGYSYEKILEKICRKLCQKDPSTG